jgi:hypothetical protein
MVLGVFGFTDAYAAAKTTKAKRTTTVAQANPPAPAKDPMCKVLAPDNLLGSSLSHKGALNARGDCPSSACPRIDQR